MSIAGTAGKRAALRRIWRRHVQLGPRRINAATKTTRTGDWSTYTVNSILNRDASKSHLEVFNLNKIPEKFMNP
jgi:hypothetical protein